MPFIPVPNTAQLELVYLWQGQRCQNVLHYVKASPWDITQLTELCEAAVVEWGAGLDIWASETLSLIEVVATDLSSQTGPVVNYAEGLPIPGSVESESLPNNCSMVITKRTQKRGRSYRGRIYVCGLTEGAVNGNQVNQANVTGLLAGWTAMLSLAITDDEANMCVVSRYQEGQPLSQGIATLVTNLTTDGVIDSQRRRLPGRGA